MRLSDHFLLADLVKTSTGLPNAPTAAAVENLLRLAPFLEAIWTEFGPITVTSGYRSEAVNRKVGGSPSSAHRLGCAADFVAKAPVKDVVAWLARSSLPFDQVIDEQLINKDGSQSVWTHLGIAKPGSTPRRDVLARRGSVYLRLNPR